MESNTQAIALNEARTHYVVNGHYQHVASVFNDLNTMLSMMGRQQRPVEQKGSLEAYSEYKAVFEEFRQSAVSNQTFFSSTTHLKVKAVLGGEIGTGTTLRIWYGDPVTGCSYMDAYDVVGTVSRSTGTFKVPLLVKTTRSRGGCALLTSIIVRIDDVKRRVTRYVHPDFHVPAMKIVEDASGELFSVVEVDSGQIHLRANTRQKALNYIAFQEGTRYRL